MKAEGTTGPETALHVSGGPQTALGRRAAAFCAMPALVSLGMSSLGFSFKNDKVGHAGCA